MLRRLIANSLIVVWGLGVFLPVALALQPPPMMACCRRAGHHHCKCCSGKKSSAGGPEFRDGSSDCPCGSQIPTRTGQGHLPQHLALIQASPVPDFLAATRSSSFHSVDRFQQSERGPPNRQR